MEIVESIKGLKAESVKKEFADLMSVYLNPAFGAITKRDFDIHLFITLQRLGVISPNPEIYEIVTKLRVTRSKARSLLYESKLRQTSTPELDEELKNLLKNPIFLKDNDKIGIEVDNPYLIDHLRARLKKLNYITDGSFAPELVRLTTEAYAALFESCLPEESKDKIKKAFVAIGAKADTSLKGILIGVIKKLGGKIADKAGEGIAEKAVDYMGPIVSGSIDVIKEKFGEMFKEK